MKYPVNMSRRVVASLAAGTLVLAACGSDANESTDTSADVETTEAPAGDDSEAMDEEVGTIVDVASSAGTFNTLVAAVDAAGLVETLSSEGPFTVFAPTDDAFAALPEGLVDALLLPENSDTLTAILTYHGLLAAVPSSDVVAGDVATIQGDNITISVDGDTIMVNDATVIAADVNASNGVIHVIDTVLVPPSIDVTTLLGS